MIILEQFSPVLHKNIYCGYSLEVPHEVFLMSTHNVCFYGEMRIIIPGHLKA